MYDNTQDLSRANHNTIVVIAASIEEHMVILCTAGMARETFPMVPRRLACFQNIFKFEYFRKLKKKKPLNELEFYSHAILNIRSDIQ